MTYELAAYRVDDDQLARDRTQTRVLVDPRRAAGPVTDPGLGVNLGSPPSPCPFSVGRRAPGALGV